MSENNITGLYPLSTVRFGMGKEIRLYTDELAVTGSEEDQETRLQLSSIKRLILMPGDPNPAKLILMADLTSGIEQSPRLDTYLLRLCSPVLSLALCSLSRRGLHWRTSLGCYKAKTPVITRNQPKCYHTKVDELGILFTTVHTTFGLVNHL